MKLKIPPPIVGLLLGYLMWSIAQHLGGAIVFDFQNAIAISVLIVGLIIDAAAILSFHLAKTTVNPMKPDKASELVNQGIYNYSRNPMYLGLLVVLTAFAIWLGQLFNLAVIVFYVWYITTFQIKPEERVLADIFGDNYLSYKAKVRRWI